MARYWIGVASKEHVQRGVVGGFAQVCHGKASPLNRMEEGDWIVYYSPTIKFGQKEPCQSFTAVGKIKEKEMFSGFSKEQQAEYERQIIERFGEQGKAHIEESKQNAKKWSKSDEEKFKNEFTDICKELTRLLTQKSKASTKEVQSVIRRHYLWLKNFWTPTKESYAGHGQFIADSDLRKAYEEYHPRLPEFIAEAIQIFADKEMN